MRRKVEQYGVGDTSWLDSAHGLHECPTATVAASDLTKATHYPDGYLKSGTPVDISDRRALKPWSDKTGTQLGFVLYDHALSDGDKISVPVYVHGRVRTRRIPGTFTKPTTAPQPQFVFNEGTDA